MLMISTVEVAPKVYKALRKLPVYIVIKFQDWVKQVEKYGLQEVRKVKSYHDEPLRGKLKGLRSIRLSKGYRAYYRIVGKQVEVAFVERIDKHEY